MQNGRNIGLYIFLAIAAMFAFTYFGGGSLSAPANEKELSEFVQLVKSGDVSQAAISGENIEFTSNGTKYFAVRTGDFQVTQFLIDNNVQFEAESQKRSPLVELLYYIFPVLLLIGFWFFMMNRMQGGGKGGAMGFGKSRAKMLTEAHGRVTFDDVAGIDEAKEELSEIVDFLREPTKFSRLGGKIPKGALLEGPPGTGKTLLARAVAGEAGVPFFTISGSDFVEMFVGVGASRVRDMFEQAKKNAPCIVFIDEIDAVGRHRGAGHGGGNDEREQTLNQLLVEMDGFEGNEGVILIAATNRKDVLDPALLRPGRFDRQVVVGLPDIKGRTQILEVHSRKVPLGPNVDMRVIGRGTPGFSGADLANLINEAALQAARKGQSKVTMFDFEFAKDKIMMGPAKKSMVMSVADKEMTAYHEAGHALLGMLMPEVDPVYKATILPRGGALGFVMSVPEEETHSYHKVKMIQELGSVMAGKAAEIFKYGEDRVSSGASGDIQQASRLARAMVMQWGMSEKVGNIDYSEARAGYSGQTGGFSVSAETKNIIEQEVKRLIDDGYELAMTTIKKNKTKFERIAQGLLEYETLTGDEIEQVMNGKKLDRDEDGNPPTKPKSGVTVIPSTGRAKKATTPKPATEN